MKYATILFDADGTLFDFDKSEKNALTEVLNFFGIDATESMTAGYNKINDSLWKMLERNEIDKESLKTKRFEIFCDKYKIGIEPSVIAKNYIDALSNQTEYIDGAVRICKVLSEKCRLYIITNGIKYVQDKRIKKSMLYPYFQDIFISDEIGYEKPSTAFFEAVSNKIDGFCKNTTLVVGDSLTSDIRGGINFDLDVCWFNQKEIKEPTNLNINYTITKLDELIKIIY